MKCRLLAAGLMAAAVLLAGPAALAQGRDFGRTTIRVPDATTDGDWPGTWVFENRLRKIAMWVREGDDGLRVRIKQLMLTSAETFDTEWDGEASYAFPDVEGDMRIAIDESDPDEARGTWHWRSTTEQLTVVESGRFTLFRTADGRYLVMRFDELSLERIDGDAVNLTTPPRVWTFRKTSRRLADWDELAF